MSAIANLTATTIRNIINTRLRSVLDEATDRWGIRISRVELKSIDPPTDVRNAMEQMLKAERGRSIREAQGAAEARRLIAAAEAEAILAVAGAQAKGEQTINEALKESAPTREVVALRALRMWPASPPPLT